MGTKNKQIKKKRPVEQLRKSKTNSKEKMSTKESINNGRKKEFLNRIRFGKFTY